MVTCKACRTQYATLPTSGRCAKCGRRFDRPNEDVPTTTPFFYPDTSYPPSSGPTVDFTNDYSSGGSSSDYSSGSDSGGGGDYGGDGGDFGGGGGSGDF